jgi:hypothetical protein
MPKITLSIRSEEVAGNVASLVRLAIDTKIKRLKLGIQKSQAMLAGFEKKYNRSTEDFIKSGTAEDLEGGDLEYVEWVGEYKLCEGLKADLHILESIEYE